MRTAIVFVALVLLLSGLGCSSGLTEVEVRQMVEEYSVPGPKGDAGEPGAQAPQGEQGPKGDTGDAGEAGQVGPQGERGEEGSQGEVGPKGGSGDTGAEGQKGDAGTQGTQGTQGEAGPGGQKGERGAPYAILDRAQLVERVSEALVGIRTPVGRGSGFIFDTIGWVITNSSIVFGSEMVDVILADGTIEQGTVVGRYQDVGLAVVRIEAERSFSSIAWANDDTVFAGDEVLALGYAGADVGWLVSVSSGVISAKGTCPDGSYDPSLSVECIQTDASINTANSGGPLINLVGEVVGINLSPPQSLEEEGFAISQRWAREYIPDMMSGWSLMPPREFEVSPGESQEVPFDASGTWAMHLVMSSSEPLTVELLGCPGTGRWSGTDSLNWIWHRTCSGDLRLAFDNRQARPAQVDLFFRLLIISG